MSTWTEGRQCLLHVKLPDSEHEYFSFSTAGMLGTCGMNNRGLALCVNSIVHLDSAADGVPVAAIVRHILESASMNSAVDSLCSVVHASGQCYTLGERGRIAAFECAGPAIVPYRTWDNDERLVHTNHALVNTYSTTVRSQSDEAAQKKLPRFFFHPTRNSLARQQWLEKSVGDFSHPLSIEGIQGLLACTDDPKYPICRGGGEVQRDRNVPYTTGSVVWELNDSAPVAHIAAGPPDTTQFVTFRF